MRNYKVLIQHLYTYEFDVKALDEEGAEELARDMLQVQRAPDDITEEVYAIYQGEGNYEQV